MSKIGSYATGGGGGGITPIVYTVQTVDATPTALATIPVPANSSVTIFGSYVASRADFSGAAGGDFTAPARRAGAGALLVGVPFVDDNDDVGGAIAFNIVIVGNSLVIRVTGEVATVWNWKALSFNIAIQ